ncbi:MAG: SynChlorMet cassette protein ScmD [Candidatus Saganbacteria bacterium]|nr:SynChlorMet cassette protein ScmD [Candidatus Saganbacteria bacterium]
MVETKNPVANSVMVLREEFDDWAVLFNPDTGQAFGMNPISVYIWKNLDGKHPVGEIVKDIRVNYNNVPGEVDEHVNKFIADLVERGFVGYKA